MDNNLYIKILDFVVVCKKFEYLIKQKYSLESNKPLMREYGQKNIPRSGVFNYNGQSIDFYIHGTGITYKVGDIDFSHNFFLGKGLDICFNIWNVLKYHKIDYHDDYVDQLNKLIEKNYLVRLYDNANQVYLV